MATIEKRLEGNFVRWCRDRQIEPIKGPVGLSKGFPDRFLQLPHGGGTIYVEFKGSSSYSLTPLQVWWKNTIQASSPNRYFFVENDAQLEELKKACLRFMAIGPELHKYETKLLENML